MHHFTFYAVDSWCFRESRPMGSVGGVAIASMFPPPANTLIGATRTLVGNALETDWSEFARDSDHSSKAIIGDGEQCGSVTFSSPYLRVNYRGNDTRLYPAPSFLARKDDKLYAMTVPQDSVNCDLGNVRLPELPAQAIGAKLLEDTYVTEAGMNRLKQGQLPSIDDLISTNDLIESEIRLGIARNNRQGSVIEGHLYQTEHVRIKNSTDITDIRLVVDVYGLPEDVAKILCSDHHTIRCGGEGRMAQVSVTEANKTESNNAIKKTPETLLYLVSHADFGSDLPSDATPTINEAGQTQWQCTVNGVEFTIISAFVNKPIRQGGWDVKTKQPKPVKSLTPAGSCYLISTADVKSLQDALEQYKLGAATDFGFGHAMLLPAQY